MTPPFDLPRIISIFSIMIIASGSAWHWVTSTPNEDLSPWLAAIAAGFSSLLWGSLIYPKMGHSYTKDTFWIILSPLFIGSLTGTILSFGLLPIGIPAGIYVAYSHPYNHPYTIGPLYLLGIVLAFYLPRIKLNFLER